MFQQPSNSSPEVRSLMQTLATTSFDNILATAKAIALIDKLPRSHAMAISAVACVAPGIDAMHMALGAKGGNKQLIEECMMLIVDRLQQDLG